MLFAEGEPIATSPLGASFALWAIRLSMVCYFLALAFRFLRRDALARGLWTMGALACLAHIALAMHVYHSWSHAAAYSDTARQTREVVGLDWGGGIYFNYLFAAMWLADVAWWWIWPERYQDRPRGVSILVHGYLLFIVLNATVVFETGVVRWVTLVACAGLLCLWAVQRPGQNRAIDKR